MNIQAGKTGCDLREKCGFFCDTLYLYRKSDYWKVMIANYCEGVDFPLCARRNFFYKTGNCAPWDMTPVGNLPEELLPEMFLKD